MNFFNKPTVSSNFHMQRTHGVMKLFEISSLSSRSYYLTAAFCLSMAGCGGGGGGDSTGGRPDAIPPLSRAEPGLYLVAGNIGGRGFVNGVGSEARFFYPEGLTVDKEGNVFVADTQNFAIRKVTPSGAVSTYYAAAAGEDLFRWPTRVVVTPTGTLRVLYQYAQLSQITSTGEKINDLTGSSLIRLNTSRPYGLTFPTGITYDAAGNLYASNPEKHVIRRISPAGQLETIAGTDDVSGNADGDGRTALFSYPSGIATDTAGNLYVADMNNHTIRKRSASGVVSTLAGAPGIAGSTDGAASAARFNLPRSVAVDALGNIYVADLGNCTVRKVTPDGNVSTFAGLAGALGAEDGRGSAARFSCPRDLSLDSAGNVYVADTHNDAIRKITPDGTVTTLAGNPRRRSSVDGNGTLASFRGLNNMVEDKAGNIYVADTENGTVRRISPKGDVTTFAGKPESRGNVDGRGSEARFNYPYGIAIDGSDNLYVTDNPDNTFAEWPLPSGGSTVRKIAPDGAVTTLAGNPAVYGTTDGPGATAAFSRLRDIVVDRQGNAYVADELNRTIRKISPQGMVSTLAGNRVGGGWGERRDGKGIEALFTQPKHLAIDSNGDLFVTGDCNVRKVTQEGVVTTVSTGSTSTEAGCPSKVVFDSSGNMYTTFNGSRSEPVVSNWSFIRKTTPDGKVTTIAGSEQAHRFTEPGPLPGRLETLTGLTYSSNGSLLVATDGAVLRIVLP